MGQLTQHNVTVSDILINILPYKTEQLKQHNVTSAGPTDTDHHYCDYALYYLLFIILDIFPYFKGES